MNTRSIFICCFMIGFLAFNMGVTGTQDWENPEIFSVNKTQAHATLIPFADEATALLGDKKLSPYYQCLNGDWKFHWVR
ncbi:hypothetical protein GF373_08000, partial [bacterium]|nr:hypothetical protein [bacterium]